MSPRQHVAIVFTRSFFFLQGIPLGAAVAYTLADQHGRDVGFSYNRKEPKDHGEGGLLVGEALKVSREGGKVLD